MTSRTTTVWTWLLLIVPLFWAKLWPLFRYSSQNLEEICSWSIMIRRWRKKAIAECSKSGKISRRSTHQTGSSRYDTLLKFPLLALTVFHLVLHSITAQPERSAPKPNGTEMQCAPSERARSAQSGYSFSSQSSYVIIIQTIFMALLVGSIYFDLGLSQSSIQVRTNLVMNYMNWALHSATTEPSWSIVLRLDKSVIWHAVWSQPVYVFLARCINSRPNFSP